MVCVWVEAVGMDSTWLVDIHGVDLTTCVGGLL